MQGLHMCGPRPARKQPPAIHGRAGDVYKRQVLGFNFVGDGLRDAFDPKMKR